MGRKYIDLTGEKFGRLTVLERVDDYVSPKGQKQKQYLCKCECGKNTITHGNSLMKGVTQSCGCFNIERRQVKSKKRKYLRISSFNIHDDKYTESQNSIFAIYRKGAESREIYFSIDISDFVLIIKKDCYYCGVEPRMKLKDNLDFLYNGLDRIDNEKGYQIDNVVPCCWDCNRAKGRKSLSDFLSWLDRFNGRKINQL